MSELLQLFFEAIDNYDLYGEEDLIRAAVRVCLDENPKENFQIFCQTLAEIELGGTTDLSGPITSYYCENYGEFTGKSSE